MNCMLFSSRFQQYIRKLLLLVFLFVPFQPIIHAMEAAENSDSRQTVLSEKEQSSLKKKYNLPIVTQALGELTCAHQSPSIINANEWHELDLDLLIDRLDTTKTTFGRWGLAQMLYPTTDEYQIMNRQSLIKRLVKQDQVRNRIGKLLEIIQNAEMPVVGTQELEEYEVPIFGGLLAYWDQRQYKEGGSLFNSITNLYYRFMKKKLNNTSLALEGSVLFEIGRTSLMLLGLIGLTGVGKRIMLWEQSDDLKIPSLREAFMEELKQTFSQFWPRSSQLGQAYNILARDKDVIVPTPSSDSLEKQKMFRVLGKRILVGHGTIGDRLSQIKTDWTLYKKQDTSFLKRAGMAGIYAGAGTVITAGSAYMLWQNSKQTLFYWIDLFKSTKRLHRHMVAVAHAFDAMEELCKIVTNDSILGESCIAEHLGRVFHSQNCSSKMKTLRKLFKTSTFHKADSFVFYSRGRLLHAHRLMQDLTKELVPALQGIAELDALYALACNVKEREKTTTPFSFVEFDHNSPVAISFTNCWIPVIDDVVPNSINFGNNYPTKLVITGPNGGGKSTFLKALGHCAVLAQSWGIVPAQKARMSMFNELRTCIHPQESLKDGMSTFMSEKARVDEICSLLHKRHPGHRVMLLLDEPFKGTVDAESAQRIYDFGMHISPLTDSIVCIATHVEKPIHLAQDTKGSFSNRHVIIKELANGEFKREFRLADGPALWWFNDREKRSRFVDWLGEEICRVKKNHKTKQKQAQ